MGGRKMCVMGFEDSIARDKILELAHNKYLRLQWNFEIPLTSYRYFAISEKLNVCRQRTLEFRCRTCQIVVLEDGTLSCSARALLVCFITAQMGTTRSH